MSNNEWKSSNRSTQQNTSFGHHQCSLLGCSAPRYTGTPLIIYSVPKHTPFTTFLSHTSSFMSHTTFIPGPKFHLFLAFFVSNHSNHIKSYQNHIKSTSPHPILDDKGKLHDFCGRTHALTAKTRGIISRNDSLQPADVEVVYSAGNKGATVSVLSTTSTSLI